SSVKPWPLSGRDRPLDVGFRGEFTAWNAEDIQLTEFAAVIKDSVRGVFLVPIIAISPVLWVFGMRDRAGGFITAHKQPTDNYHQKDLEFVHISFHQQSCCISRLRGPGPLRERLCLRSHRYGEWNRQQ